MTARPSSSVSNASLVSDGLQLKPLPRALRESLDDAEKSRISREEKGFRKDHGRKMLESEEESSCFRPRWSRLAMASKRHMLAAKLGLRKTLWNRPERYVSVIFAQGLVTLAVAPLWALLPLLRRELRAHVR